MGELEVEQDAVMQMVQERPEVMAMVRDGLCHETVMWYVHHLPEATKEEVKRLISLPLLPETYHQNLTQAEAQERYQSQVSCAVCHVKLRTGVLKPHDGVSCQGRLVSAKCL